MAETEHTRAARRPLAHLPSKFQVAAPDNAMAPRVPAGTNAEFDTMLSPRDGDGALVRRSDGEVYFRLYRDTRDGCFEAVPLNPSYTATACVSPDCRWSPCSRASAAAGRARTALADNLSNAPTYVPGSVPTAEARATPA